MAAIDLLSGEGFESICDANYPRMRNALGRRVCDRGVVFCKTDYVEGCLAAMKDGDGPYVLVTHNSDYPSGLHELPDNVVKWFGVNMAKHDDRHEGIPMGLANSRYAHGNGSAVLFQACQKKHIDKAIYVHFAMNTNREARVPARRWFRESEWVTDKCYSNGPNRGDYAEYLKGVHSHQYVVSPQGNGVDCHRHWEAMYLGAIPIIKRDTALFCFEDYPVLWVDDWPDATKRVLGEGYDELLSRPFDYRKLYLGYWKERFKESLEGVI